MGTSLADRPDWVTDERMKQLTEFQKVIVRVVDAAVNQQACTWTIAQVGFPEKWVKHAGRGALIGHIDRAGMKMPDLIVRLPAKDEFGTATLCRRR